MEGIELNDVMPFIMVIFLFYSGVVAFRMAGILKRKKCPACAGRLIRKERTANERIFNILTFNILPLKRYKCLNCGWIGSRWSIKKKKKLKHVKAFIPQTHIIKHKRLSGNRNQPDAQELTYEQEK